MQKSLQPIPILVIVSAIFVAIGIFFAIVAFRLLRNAPNRNGHLLPARFYFWLGGALTLSFFAVLWGMYKKGDFSDLEKSVLCFSFLIGLCRLANRAARKPAPGYHEV